MKVVISGGGTGGHLSPALALGEELKRMRPEAELLFIGTQAGLDQQFLSRSGFRYELLDVGGVRGRGPEKLWFHYARCSPRFSRLAPY